MSVNSIGSASTSSTQQVHQHGHHGHSGMRKAGMDAAAKALGINTSDLQTALKGGQTLASLAKSKGISTDSLASAISGALSKANPALSSDRVQQITQRMINGPGSGGSGVAGA